MIFTADNISKVKTLADLKSTDYKPKSIKEELRNNLIAKLKNKQKVFEGIWGYEDTVIPEVERAILSKHNFILLGLRGQAKTRIARLMVNLLDEYIPYITDTELFDDPFAPISRKALDILASQGDNTPISFLHRNDRYNEKLATPDVTISDLIGDVDPIKAASLKLPYSDERVLHFGLIPRSHRQLFVINELPDLQARIQVSLFNILQEGDIQIRGFKMRLPLDIQFVFTANPEDYTNRGSIVTPLKDRIESQIITHYPKSLEVGKKITLQEANYKQAQTEKVKFHPVFIDIIEQIAIEARKSEYIDAKSGVSARLTISALENLLSAAERRMLLNNENETQMRIGDLWGIIPSITGKMELVYEGEQEGSTIVAQNLIGLSLKSTFTKFFPDPERFKKKKNTKTNIDKPQVEVVSPYSEIINWFASGNNLDLMLELNQKEYADKLESVTGLKKLVNELHPSLNKEDKLVFMEFALHGLADFSLIGKNRLETGHQFKDLFASMFSADLDDEME